MQKERPILFSTPMVQALLAGTKTMTRRTTGLDAVNKTPGHWEHKDFLTDLSDGDIKKAFFDSKFIDNYAQFIKCPYGQVGDLLWVRETFCINDLDETKPYRYMADNCPLVAEYAKWKPSIHMPKAAARIWLEITNVRVERLQDITGEDALLEGVKVESIWPLAIGDAYRAFKSLWHSINGEESWNANPWVWVVEFKKVSHE
jgi:hypothetical protein